MQVFLGILSTIAASGNLQKDPAVLAAESWETTKLSLQNAVLHELSGQHLQLSSEAKEIAHDLRVALEQLQDEVKPGKQGVLLTVECLLAAVDTETGGTCDAFTEVGESPMSALQADSEVEGDCRCVGADPKFDFVCAHLHKVMESNPEQQAYCEHINVCSYQCGEGQPEEATTTTTTTTYVEVEVDGVNPDKMQSYDPSKNEEIRKMLDDAQRHMDSAKQSTERAEAVVDDMANHHLEVPDHSEKIRRMHEDALAKQAKMEEATKDVDCIMGYVSRDPKKALDQIRDVLKACGLM